MAIAFDDDNCNPTNNEHFQQVLDKSLANPARRRLIRGGFGLAALSATAMLPTFAHANTASAPGKTNALGFASLEKTWLTRWSCRRATASQCCTPAATRSIPG